MDDTTYHPLIPAAAPPRPVGNLSLSFLSCNSYPYNGDVMEKDDFFVKTDIERNIRRVTELLDTEALNSPNVFQESVLIEVMVKLHDLLQTLSQLGYRINFTEDVVEGDVTDLVSKIRNLACHSESEGHFLDKEHHVKFTFNVSYGKGNLAIINGRELTSDYDDDVCFFFGEQKIYLKRHILRALQEAQEKYKELYGSGLNPLG